MDRYDSGRLGDYGGGNVEWWQDYLRAEIGKCNDHYQEGIVYLEEEIARLKGEIALWKQRAEQARNDWGVLVLRKEETRGKVERVEEHLNRVINFVELDNARAILNELKGE